MRLVILLLISTLLLIVLIKQITPASPEPLLQAVDSNHALRIAEYNHDKLEELRYFSVRYRIVTLNKNALSSKTSLTLNLFPDEGESYVFTYFDGAQHKTFVRWRGVAAINAGTSIGPARIVSSSYDTKADGTATHSKTNLYRPEQLEMLQHQLEYYKEQKNAAMVEQIEKQKLSLAQDAQSEWDKGTFWSVSSLIEIYDPVRKKVVRYSISPLQFSPKFAVVAKLDDSKTFHTRIDPFPGELDLRSNEDQNKEAEFRRRFPFKRSKPKAIMHMPYPGSAD